MGKGEDMLWEEISEERKCYLGESEAGTLQRGRNRNRKRGRKKKRRRRRPPIMVRSWVCC